MVAKNPLDQLYRRPGFLIRRAHQIAVSLFLEETGDLGITNRQYGILLVPKRQPKIDQITVAKLLGHDRQPPAGERRLARLAEPARRAQARVLSAFTPGEQRQFLNLLDKFTRAFNDSTRVPHAAHRADGEPKRRKGRRR